MKRRILFVANTRVYGGTEKHLIDLIQSFYLSDVDPMILCFGSDVYSRILNEQRKLCIRIHGMPKPEGFLAYWKPFLYLRPHVIVFVNAWLGLFPWYAYVAARLSPAKQVVAIEHLLADPPPPEVEVKRMGDRLRKMIGWRSRYMFRLRLSGRMCDRVICVSNGVRDTLVEDYGYPGNKTLTILNGVDIQKYNNHAQKSALVRKALEIGSRDFVVVCVAQLNPQKRIDVLLDAMSQILIEYPSCKCVIVGSGVLETDLRRRAKELGLASSVIFVGFADDVRPYLSAGDVFVLSSRKEGLPLALLEAMASGLPVVATNVPGNTEAIIDGHNGLIVPPDSPDQLAGAIKYLLLHPQERQRMAMNGRKRVEESFNIDETMTKIRVLLLS